MIPYSPLQKDQLWLSAISELFVQLEFHVIDCRLEAALLIQLDGVGDRLYNGLNRTADLEAVSARRENHRSAFILSDHCSQ